MIIACIISFIVGAMMMMCAIGMVAYQKDKKPRNKVHFYVARDSTPLREGMLNLWINKPGRGVDIWYAGKSWARHIAVESDFELFGLNPSDYDDLKWEDEPVEVFLNLED